MNIFFLYSQPRQAWISAVRKKHIPNHALYGASLLKKNYHVVTSDIGFAKNNLWRFLASPIQTRFLKQTGVGFQIDQVISLIKKINATDIIITTNDSCGLPVAWLKQLGIIRIPQLYCHIGFSQHSSLVENLLKAPEKILCFSASQVKKIPNSIIFPPGVDINFFKPTHKKPKLDVFAVGRDIHRDYTTLLVACARLHLPATIACDPKNIIGLPTPKNISILHNQSYLQIRRLYHQTKIVIIPVTKNSVSGQISLLEAFACGKPVIAARNPALVKTFGLIHSKHCLLYTPENVRSLETQLNLLIKNTRLRHRLSQYARIKAKEFSSVKFASALTALARCVLASRSPH